MTYCVGMMLQEGLLFAADTRTNAGVDNISVFRKLHTWSDPGERVFVLLSAGNLAITQAVVSLLTENAGKASKTRPELDLFTAKSMFQAARTVGAALRDVKKIDGEHLGAQGEAFHASFILGGQIGTERTRLFNIYAAGNFIEATADTPYFQIGEHKYGKPILDRVAHSDMSLGEAAKLMLVSFDSTMRSNLSVGLPIDLLVYKTGRLSLEPARRIERDDPYFQKLSADWSRALRGAFSNIEDYDI